MSDDVQVRLRLPKHLAGRLLLLPSGVRAAVVAAGLDHDVTPAPSVTVSEVEKEALRVAIGMFRSGAAGGGKIGFRAEQKYLHQFTDYADDLAALWTRLGVSQ